MACEDAPCCGCCGPLLDAADALSAALLDAADALSAAERYYDGDDFYEDDYYGEDDEDADEDDPRDGNEDAAMESALWGEC